MEKFDTVEDYRDHLIKEKVNCYTCVYKGSVAGSCHLSCTVELPSEVKKLNLLALAKGVVEKNPSYLEVNKIPMMDWVEAGLRNGYVLYPFNFDPVWLNYCLMHKKK